MHGLLLHPVYPGLQSEHGENNITHQLTGYSFCWKPTER